MKRPQSPDSSYSMDLRPVEWALVNYYARKHNKTPEKIVGLMIQAYAHADLRFDGPAFIQFVRSELVKDQEDNAVRDQVLRDALRYARDREQAGEPTVTLAADPRRLRSRGT